MSCVILKPGKEKSLYQRHPWIFSGAIASRPEHKAGDIFPVYSSQKELLGHAYFHPTNSIAGRMLNFSSEHPLSSLLRSIDRAIELRESLVPHQGRRLINGEGDEVPGLIVDQYNSVLVIQIYTAGIDRLKTEIVHHLIQKLSPRTVYEKSVSPARSLEGLSPVQRLLYGNEQSEITIEEHGIPFIIQPLEGQKTGFFLDQREMRRQIMHLSEGKRVLNCFAYTGGFSIAALQGGASHVTSVDISKEACLLAKRHTKDLSNHTIVQADVFEFLRQDSLHYDIIILDPPAFAKKRSDLEAASKGYRGLNREVLKKIPSKSLLLTSSCSSYMTADLFQKIVFQSAADTKRFVRILSKHAQAFDHPVSLYHPEGDYLKSLILHVE